MVEARIRSGGAYPPSFFILLVIAGLIGAVSAACADWSQVRGAIVQLLVNVVLLIAVGAGGLTLQRFIWRARVPPAG